MGCLWGMGEGMRLGFGGLSCKFGVSGRIVVY